MEMLRSVTVTVRVEVDTNKATYVFEDEDMDGVEERYEAWFDGLNLP